ncbi:MAG: AAA family ATPase [Candidatus Omnitrophica bacterium]|nr:AAA family ATPase [Candidatus Omnitrophota bacterium]
MRLLRFARNDVSRNSEKHFTHLAKLLEIEEAEEIAQFKEFFLNKTPEERELTGFALLRLAVHEIHYSGAGHMLLSFKYQIKKPIPLYSPDAGDLVTVAPTGSALADNFFATVYEKTNEIITVALDRHPPDWFNEDELYDLSIAGNRGSYRKMREALKAVATQPHGRLAFLRDISLGIKKPESYDTVKPEDIAFLNSSLNQWQKEAVVMALSSRDIAIVHGPPGTGKTTVLVEIIRQSIAKGEFILATAPSNTACDHMLECLVKEGVHALRLGHPARIMENLRDHTLDFKLAHHRLARTVDELEAEMERLEKQRGRRRDRGALSRIEREEITDRLRDTKQEIRMLENQIFAEVIEKAPVIIATHTGASDSILRRKKVNLLVMDEASQATEPSSWIPLLHAEKVIFAGDHFQLPPTVISKKAEDRGLNRTLFERIHGLVGDSWKKLLRVQYRMNEKIMNFSSREFYEGALIADESVKHHTLADLPHVKHAPETEESFIFLDTAGRGFEEALEPGSESRFNREEAAVIVRHLNRLLELGLKPQEVALISPYSAQVRLLSSMIEFSDLEIDSVDGFQGREKEAVLLSLVRSNVEGEMGFLTDTRRMNVAMTRARRKLFVVGDSATLACIPFYRDFIQYAESIGAYRSVWEAT